MSIDEIEQIDVRKFNVQAGDVIVFRFVNPLPMDKTRRITDVVNLKFDEAGISPRPPIMILDAGASVEVLRAETLAK